MKCKNVSKELIAKYIDILKDNKCVWVYNTSLLQSETGIDDIHDDCMNIENEIYKMNENLNHLEMELLKSEGIRYLNENFEIYIWEDEEYEYWNPIYFWYNPNDYKEEEMISITEEENLSPIMKNLFSRKYTAEEMFVQFAELNRWIKKRETPPE